MQDLVGPRASDAGDCALVPQQRVKSSRVGGADVGETVGVDVERVGAEMSELFVRRLGAQEPYPRTLLRSGLGEHQLRAVLKAQAERGHLRALLPRSQVAEAPVGHQMDEEYELSVLGGKEQPLAPALCPRQSPALELCQGRIEGLERGHV